MKTMTTAESANHRCRIPMPTCMQVTKCTCTPGCPLLCMVACINHLSMIHATTDMHTPLTTCTVNPTDTMTTVSIIRSLVTSIADLNMLRDILPSVILMTRICQCSCPAEHRIWIYSKVPQFCPTVIARIRSWRLTKLHASSTSREKYIFYLALMEIRCNIQWIIDFLRHKLW